MSIYRLFGFFFLLFFSYFQVEAMQQAGGEQAQQAQEMLKDQVNTFVKLNKSISQIFE